MNENSGHTPHPEGPEDIDGSLEDDAERSPEEAPRGGGGPAQDQLDADLPVEEDTLRALDPDAPPA